MNFLKKNFQALSEFETKHYYNSSHRLKGYSITDDLPTSGEVLAFKIADWREPTGNSQKSKNFLSYLASYNIYNFILNTYIQSETISPSPERLYPVIQYFSPHRNSSVPRSAIDLHDLNLPELANLYKNSTSRSSNSAADYVIGFLAMKKNSFDNQEESFQKDSEIITLKRVLVNFGFSGVNVDIVNRPKNLYKVTLTSGTKSVDVMKLSSGEREVVLMVLSILAYGVKNGVIIIDEPELHMHPRWQKKLLDAFGELQAEKNIQFIMVTHSPFLIDSSSLGGVFRVYKENFVSHVVKYGDSNPELAEKDYYGAINALTIERSFFVDKVVLVEGISDRIVFKAIFDRLLTSGQEITIELIDVGGKQNFGEFCQVLDSFRINKVLIADQDYAIDLKLIDKDCLELNEKGKIKSLRNRGSNDRTSLLKVLNRFTPDNRGRLTEEDFGDLMLLNSYLNSRHTKIAKSCLGQLRDKIKDQYEKGVYILMDGDLESYFENKGKINLEKALEIRDKIANRKIEIPEEISNIVNLIIST
jgi:hypothetical protein